MNQAAPEDSPLTFRTTFHPDYDYAQFVGSYKPKEAKQNCREVLNQEELLLKLSEMKSGQVEYPIHKFSAQYSNSLRKLSPQEKKYLVISAGFPESMTVEMAKGITVGEHLSPANSTSSILYRNWRKKLRLA